MAETLEEQKPPEEMNRLDDSENEHQEDQRNAEEPQNLPNAHVEDPPRLGEKRISFNLEEELESSIKGGAPACNDAEQSFNIAPTTDSEEAGPMQEEEVVGTISNVTPTVRASNRFLGSFRKSKRRFKKFREIYNAPKEPPDSCDILSTLIEGQMFHIAFSILSELSAADMETCERVCRTWANFIQSERLWERSVKKRAKTMSELVKNNGWGTYISNIGPAKSCKSNEMRSVSY